MTTALLVDFSSSRTANGAVATSPGERLATLAVKFNSAGPVLGWSVKVVPSVLPWMLKPPLTKSPSAYSESFQAAKVIVAPNPRTKPPAKMARILGALLGLLLRASSDEFSIDTVTITPPKKDVMLLSAEPNEAAESPNRAPRQMLSGHNGLLAKPPRFYENCVHRAETMRRVNWP